MSKIGNHCRVVQLDGDGDEESKQLLISPKYLELLGKLSDEDNVDDDLALRSAYAMYPSVAKAMGLTMTGSGSSTTTEDQDGKKINLQLLLRRF